MKRTATLSAFWMSIFVMALLAGSVYPQLDKIDKGRAKDMLTAVTDDVKKYYYDESLHGVDMDARVQAAKDKIDNAKSLGEAFGIIAQVLLDLNDSHTRFFPPSRAVKFEYGWKVKMVGDRCFVTSVKPGSDADKKGLRTGDEVLSLNGFPPSRRDLSKMIYYYYALNPQAKFAMTVKTPMGETKQIVAETKIKKMSRFLNLNNSTDFNEFFREITDEDESYDHRFVKKDGLVIWRMPTFSFEPGQVDSLFDAHVKGSTALILDLRGNGGGLVDTLEKMVGNLFDKDLKIADEKRRDKTEQMESKSRGGEVYQGKLIILVDSGSASASEILARFVQLKGRGKIVGDTSAGAVMESRSRSKTMGVNTQIFYGASISEADVIFEDGKSIERIGVRPDILALPTAEDIGYERDPVLAQAAKELGFSITPEEAGSLFPNIWNDGKKGVSSYKKK